VRELERRFPERTHCADLEEPGAARALVDAVVGRDGCLDVLVHAVGDFRDGALTETRVEHVEQLFASNVTTSVRLFDAARTGLRSAGGCALFFGVAGLEGLRGRVETAAYAAAKSALLVLVRSWALEEAPHGVRVNMLSPGIVPHEHADEATLDPRRHARVPAGRPGTPEEVASAALFLCSDGAGYVTGADLPVAGGYGL
jgi:NAD(P)-dependent dehydrogenase (short-subunit alcohol dehydrogenase family)